MAHIVTDASFDQEVLSSSLPVLVDFYADWCGPCQMMAPVLNKLSAEYDGKVKIVKINVDTSMNTAAKYGIQGIPAFKIFQSGSVVEEFVGARPESALRAILDKYASASTPTPAPAAASAKVWHATDASFDQEVLSSSLPVLVDFYADWCGPCQMMAPVLNKLAVLYEGKYKIVKVNVDEAMETAARYGIQGIPAFKIFKSGTVVEEFSGAKPEAQLAQIMDTYL